MAIYDIDDNTLRGCYDISGNSPTVAYDVSGNIIYTSGSVDYDDYTISSLYSINVANCQGIALYNDVLFQFRASGTSITDKVCLYNFEDGSAINTNMTIESDHGDSATFSNEYYSEGDEFPLLYVTADTTPAIIYVNRITRSSATLVKTLKFPLSAGYYGAGAFDFGNNICYLLAYKKNNYQTDDGGTNTTVVSKWDLNNLTDNGDGTYTPAFISQYERAFIYVMQGLAYHDGYIWVSSGYVNGAASNVFAMVPDTGVIEHTITMDNTIEVEGVDFVYDNDLQSYYMIVGQQGGMYKKVTFG